MQTWVVKLSKLCNMRCSYCYEWNDLANPTRMSLDLWRKILSAAIEYDELQAARRGGRHVRNVLFVLHGGEPLTLPIKYLEEVLSIFDEMTSATPGVFRVAVQSNLFSVKEDKLNLLLKHRVGISVSYDAVPGVRLSLSGRPTEGVVSSNIDKLRERGIPLNGIAVLAKHTAPRITDVYDFYAARGMGMRILPLFDGPPERPSRDFWADHKTLTSALERLFGYWMETGCKVPIKPLDSHFLSALRHMVGLKIGAWDRGSYGDGVLLVNVDGLVYRVLDAYVPELALGNIALQRLSDILQSESYEASLVRDRSEREDHCGRCEYRTACSGGYIYDSRVTSPHAGACPTAYPCIEFMQRYVRERGYGEAELKALWRSLPKVADCQPSVSV